jgi:hypothetical protein
MHSSTKLSKEFQTRSLKFATTWTFIFNVLNAFMRRLIALFFGGMFFISLYIFWKNMFSHNNMEKNSYNLLLLWNQKRKKVHFCIWGWYMCISKHQSFHHLVSGSWKWDYLMFNLTKPKVNLTTQDLITKKLLIHKKEHQSSNLYLILVHQKLEFFLIVNSIYGHLKG